MTRCRRDLNLSALPVDMMIPHDLNPLLCIRCFLFFYLSPSSAAAALMLHLCITLNSQIVLDTRSCRTDGAADGSDAHFLLQKSQEECKDNDPCLWFTPMPSQDLRRARALFVDAVKFAVAAANSRQDIHAALQQLPDE